jgi:hypothetical protein
MTDSILKEYVGLMVEAFRLKEADITGGAKVPWGSEEHIADLESRIANLIPWRNKSPRRSATRANYSRVIQELQAELRSALNVFNKQQALTSLDAVDRNVAKE